MNRSFPLEFQKMLVLKSTNYQHLSKAMERRGFKLSKQFLHAMGTGARSVPPGQLKRICDTLHCTIDERKTLALAAVRDLGFQL
jgi:hypothetical protein